MEHKPQWKEGTIEPPSGMPQGGRPLELYEEMLGFNRKDLAGKDILDLGAGPESKFSKQLSDSGIKSNVVSLSPDFKTDTYRKGVNQSHPEGTHIAAIGQQLPFKNESFDVIVSQNVIDWLPSRGDFIALLKEVGRVLRPGGKAILGPLAHDDAEYASYSMKFSNEIMHALNEVNVAYTEEKLPEKYKQRLYAGYRSYDTVPSRRIVLLKNTT